MKRCCSCGEQFEFGVNVFTEQGRRETEISRLCEICFDDLFGDEDEDAL